MDGPRSKQRLCVRADLVVFETEPKHVSWSSPYEMQYLFFYFFLLNSIGEKKKKKGMKQIDKNKPCQ